ncbi:MULTISPECIES: aquaporin [Acidithrix]|uniref:Glycerol uptake facilitator protein n=1 Tax=Acidithrix ferrooxidans TaxID=1280514 RepID=A0A0D8HM88_9ACTN|nr:MULTISPECIES: aquaporin [Acidithrix]KJF18206.1 glycerol uptake facilitator protein [Acidithrix ferrooxidans]CAG4899838.1 unnamed protein product [Acidithrix sp. C25]
MTKKVPEISSSPSANAIEGQMVFNKHRAIWEFDFNNLAFEWRRIAAELVGTFLLVTVAAGGSVVSAISHGAISRGADVIAPGLMVTAIILFMGTISGAHLNPIVTIAFALRREFPIKRIPAYFAAQIAGALLAGWFLDATLGNHGNLGMTLPGHNITDFQAGSMEVFLTFGLISTILGTSSGAQNVGGLSALAVGGYIALAGLWASPISGASMNPVRTLGPAVFEGNYSHIWVYIVGPLVGSLLGVVFAFILRGRGGDLKASMAAQGILGELVTDAKGHHTSAPSSDEAQ